MLRFFVVLVLPHDEPLDLAFDVEAIDVAGASGASQIMRAFGCGGRIGKAAGGDKRQNG